MSAKVIALYKKLDKNALQTKLALQCAPVIADLKVSNLISVPWQHVKELFKLFKDTDIEVMLLSAGQKNASFLLYRSDRLLSYLNIAQVSKMMCEFGYDETIGLNELLKKLKIRYNAYIKRQGAFPHELGLILGYPPCDVVGFIEHEGLNFKYNGYWKVYGDLNKAMEQFKLFDIARETAISLLAQGKSFLDVMQTENIMLAI